MRKVILLTCLIALSGCQTIVTTPPADCIAFIPKSWNEPIPGAPLPEDDTLGSWQKFGVGQTGQLSKSNGRTADVIHIFSTCEANANKARPRKKFLGIF